MVILYKMKPKIKWIVFDSSGNRVVSVESRQKARQIASKYANSYGSRVIKSSSAIPGRSPLNWLVVNPDGKLLAILDSGSEAFWFTRNRGHAHLAAIEESKIDYSQAPELMAALESCVSEFCEHECHAITQARAAIDKATGR